MRLKLFNGPAPTTAAQLAVTTGTAIKTMLQWKPFNVCEVIAWGYSYDGAAAGAGVQCELLETGTVFATVTAHVDADIHKLSGSDQAAASVQGLTLGTAATGYTSAAEGTITATKIFYSSFEQPTNSFAYLFPLGQEPRCLIGNAYRIRVKAATAVNMLAWVELKF